MPDRPGYLRVSLCDVAHIKSRLDGWSIPSELEHLLAHSIAHQPALSVQDMSTQLKHIAAFPLQAWGWCLQFSCAYVRTDTRLSGHARPMVNFCARAVKLRPVIVTFLTTDAFCDRLTKELARSFEDGDKEHAQRVRYVSRCHARQSSKVYVLTDTYA